jgi:hypothetical protein
LALGRSIRDHQSVGVAATYISGLGILDKGTSFPFLYDHRTNRYDADLPEVPDVESEPAREAMDDADWMDEGSYSGSGGNADGEDGDVTAELFLQAGEDRDRLAAVRAPRGPELDHIDGAGLEALERLQLPLGAGMDPVGHVDVRGVVSDPECFREGDRRGIDR